MRNRAVIGCAALLLGAGCTSDRVRWDGAQAAPADTIGALAVNSDGTIGYIPAVATAAPRDSLACPRSAVTVVDGGSAWAAWLRRRPDSSVAVLASRSDDGGATWSAPAMVDSVDVGRAGCTRPRPSIAEAGGYVHVSYSLQAPEGFGVFFAHSMDRGATFHSPMIVVYGDRFSETATAAHGMRVAIAYEDPSGTVKRLDVALSKTQGHTFEPRERASPKEMPATRPRIAIRDTVVALSFAGTDSTQRAIRIGRIR